MRRWIPWLALAAVVVVALAVTVDRSGPSSSPEARAERLERELACPVCTGESVAGSNAPESRAMRDDIRDRIEAGQTDEAIRQAYVDVYGERILLTPERDGFGVVAWAVPVIVLLAGATGIAFALRRSSREPAAAPAARPERPRWAPVAIGAGIAVLVAATVGGVFALRAALNPRADGQTITGDAPPGPEPAVTIDTLAAAVEQRPDDFAARIAYARALVGTDRIEALRQFDAAAALDPDDPEPPAYAGWVMALLAQQVDDPTQRALLVDGAFERLDRAVETDARYADALVFRGLARLNLRDDAAGAVPDLQAFLALAPADHPLRGDVLAALERAVEAAATSTTTVSANP